MRSDSLPLNAGKPKDLLTGSRIVYQPFVLWIILHLRFLPPLFETWIYSWSLTSQRRLVFNRRYRFASPRSPSYSCYKSYDEFNSSVIALLLSDWTLIMAPWLYFWPISTNDSSRFSTQFQRLKSDSITSNILFIHSSVCALWSYNVWDMYRCAQST
jgi:hypothetical protein